MLYLSLIVGLAKADCSLDFTWPTGMCQRMPFSDRTTTFVIDACFGLREIYGLGHSTNDMETGELVGISEYCCLCAL